jgi:hypothetical protein
LFDLLVSLNSKKGCCHACTCFVLAVVKNHFCKLYLNVFD